MIQNIEMTRKFFFWNELHDLHHVDLIFDVRFFYPPLFSSSKTITKEEKVYSKNEKVVIILIIQFYFLENQIKAFKLKIMSLVKKKNLILTTK